MNGNVIAPGLMAHWIKIVQLWVGIY